MTAAVFDFHGTLAEAVRWGPSPDTILAARGYEPDHELRAAWWASAPEDIEHREHSRSAERYRSWERARLRTLVEAYGVPEPDHEELVEELYQATKAYVLRVYDDVAETLATLADAGVRLAVCSNWDWELPDLLRELGLAHHFEVVVTSARAGYRKPHPAIYRAVLEPLGACPGETVFAGDTWVPDVEGPLALGMRAVHVVRDRRLPPDGPPLPPGAARVHDLRELLTLPGLA